MSRPTVAEEAMAMLIKHGLPAHGYPSEELLDRLRA